MSERAGRLVRVVYKGCWKLFRVARCSTAVSQSVTVSFRRLVEWPGRPAGFWVKLARAAAAKLRRRRVPA